MRMGWIGKTLESIHSLQIRESLTQVVSLGSSIYHLSQILYSSGISYRLKFLSLYMDECMIVTSALMIWKALMCITGSESPVVVVLSGSMEPGFGRGDILFLQMSKDPIRVGEVVVYHVDGQEISIVHRVIKVHERRDTRVVEVLTKGDKNSGDDRTMYARGQLWLQQDHIIGRAVGFLPYVGWVTIIMTENPIFKFDDNPLLTSPFFVGKNMVKKPTVVCFQVYPGWHFKHYAILGDDVVIGDKRLACHYVSIQLLNSIVVGPVLYRSRGAASDLKDSA
ncbi:hypothetical protein HHK36_031196 [Tetracentron sinense]|uniref:Signal peptidase complex catalytic subunit SEC11 n=1 Tax=Tetracentron sinense TaxID=13715 RepID=A0A834Y944_TETSI|nr:hypothetical protein HHK36_031196 [Tetracentron sinense]